MLFVMSTKPSHRIIEIIRLEKTSKIPMSNPSPSPPCPLNMSHFSISGPKKEGVSSGNVYDHTLTLENTSDLLLFMGSLKGDFLRSWRSWLTW